MATEVKLPDMGEGITDVTISRWRVKPGDAVKAGDVIVEVATDKVDTEVSAPSAGVILQIIGSEGEIAPRHTPLRHHRRGGRAGGAFCTHTRRHAGGRSVSRRLCSR